LLAAVVFDSVCCLRVGINRTNTKPHQRNALKAAAVRIDNAVHVSHSFCFLFGRCFMPQAPSGRSRAQAKQHSEQKTEL
jgi:hypothetical protein